MLSMIMVAVEVEHDGTLTTDELAQTIAVAFDQPLEIHTQSDDGAETTVRVKGCASATDLHI